jgi:hypothetical protein
MVFHKPKRGVQAHTRERLGLGEKQLCNSGIDREANQVLPLEEPAGYH